MMVSHDHHVPCSMWSAMYYFHVVRGHGSLRFCLGGGNQRGNQRRKACPSDGRVQMVEGSQWKWI